MTVPSSNTGFDNSPIATPATIAIRYGTDTFINQIRTIYVRIRSNDQFFKRVMSSGNDQIFPINGMVVAAVCYLIGRAVEKK